MSASRRFHPFAVLFACATAAAGCAPELTDSPPGVVAFDPAHPEAALDPLARAIGDARVVLLGENGHGVGELTRLKVHLVKWLHDSLGFDVVALETGFFECGHAWRRIDSLLPRDALYACLRYPFQQAEILPLFERIREERETDHPLVLAGINPQAQGFDSGDRPEVIHNLLGRVDPGLADRVAVIDSALFLVADSGGQGDGVSAWILAHGPRARATYDSAAALTEGWDRWAIRMAIGPLDRLTTGAQAEATGLSERPAMYFQLRDEWMARAVAALTDSIAGPRKVVVWLHNDHAQYGAYGSGGHATRPVGAFLQEWYGDRVFSIGLFMGRGVITDNGRREHPVGVPATAVWRPSSAPSRPPPPTWSSGGIRTSGFARGPTARAPIFTWVSIRRR